MIFLFYYDILITTAKNEKEVREASLLRQQTEIQTESILALEKNYRAQRKSVHEYKHQLQTIHDLLESGQESVEQTRFLLEKIDRSNVGINFDPANLLYYNTADPRTFWNNFHDRIRAIHCKDACRPAYGERMGRETRLGDGETNFKELFRTLYAKGYRGPLTIEREIPAGAEQDNDIVYAVKLLKELKKEVKGE